MSDRKVIVTGATPGSLGFATARRLAELGDDVTVTSRSGDHGCALDLTDASSVAAFADWYAGHSGGRLDVLVNNAGVHLDLRSTWSEPRRTADGYEIHWRTNYLGTMHLTHLLLPMLQQTGDRTGDARVVNVVSKLHVRGRNQFLFEPLTPYKSWDAYGLSKLALVHAANEITRRCDASSVRGYSVHPGSVYTHIADRGLEGHRVLGAARRLLAPIERRSLKSPEQGARTSVHCATAPDLVPGYYRSGGLAEPSPEATDHDVAARLWDDTEHWVRGLA
jgi:NAD(P)-dependent dehydrogenase (short-subunit alcohol dehydrogenase family)